MDSNLRAKASPNYSGRLTRHNSLESFQNHHLPPLRTDVDRSYPMALDEKANKFESMASTPTLEAQEEGKGGGKGSGNNHGVGHDHDGGVDIYDPNRPKLGPKQRLHHLTWAWFTLPMSTGGLSLLIYAQPHQFPGLRAMGTVVYAINIVIYLSLLALMVARFVIHSGDMSKSLKHPREALFVPTLFLATATVITSSDRYAIPKNDVGLVWAVQGAFWAYVAVTLVLAIGQYSYIFAAHSYGLQTMMPTWILPIFPIMLSGTIASVIAETQPAAAAMSILVAGLSCQGLGFAVAVLMYAHMVGRLMQSGLPNREHRPGLFMCVGPPAFTALAIIGMAKGIPASANQDHLGMPVDLTTIRTLALISAIFLWSLSLWWFGIAVVAVVQAVPKYFHLGWWAMVFPNTGFVLATIAIGKELDNEGVLWFATGLSICLLGMYLFVLFCNIKAVITQDIMYPGRDEDVEDH
ncbi:C4-dicarboxylate transporter/malic acid transport protein [Metarhizium album ARSEF 1941]|uniref:C4-dicarboxylate transporter/malic acid transport protein n=1 Tax=Metarhizium album (strain ARSEF 1941) TaxID=1081103 RepID=A0A0B2X7L3_METAS|nr:C4-dicarboxylate transporter/malic acid transport protein [Metarhizium album ARSEF 1941]KHO01246.1 C4-dicarboxylate transporter/malic acid transport protein [Metarhizium album ARSEF 1941]